MIYFVQDRTGVIIVLECDNNSGLLKCVECSGIKVEQPIKVYPQYGEPFELSDIK